MRKLDKLENKIDTKLGGLDIKIENFGKELARKLDKISYKLDEIIEKRRKKHTLLAAYS